MSVFTPRMELEEVRQEIVRALQARRKRLARKQDAITHDLARLAEALEAARLAALAVPLLGRVARGATHVTVVDYTGAEPTTHTIPLDPSLPARASLDRVFHQARRLRRGEPLARGRLAEAARALETLDDTLARALAAEDVAALEALRPSQPHTTAKTAKRDDPRPPYRLFRTRGGDVWVGRGASKNDDLTFRVAKPWHLWLHVRGWPGAHVIVPVKRDEAPSAELLVDAAHLAAHFSDARGEDFVEVTYVARKFVRKPKGAAPGLVTMEREKVLGLRVERARLEHLLASEPQNA